MSETHENIFTFLGTGYVCKKFGSDVKILVCKGEKVKLFAFYLCSCFPKWLFLQTYTEMSDVKCQTSFD